MTAREHGSRTGHIRKIDYDQAVVEGVGAILDDEEKNKYYLPLTDANGRGIFIRPPGSDAPIEVRKAHVCFRASEPTWTEFEVPALIIQCDDISPALQRMQSPTEAYRIPAEGAVPVAVGDVLGWNRYETKPQEEPWDFTYTIECWSRYRAMAQVLLQIVMSRYPIQGSIRVEDSLGVERVYPAYVESTSDLTEIQSMVDRLCGYSVSLRIEGELTNSRVPEIQTGFVGQTVPGGSGVPSGGGNSGDGIDPGPGGLIGDGQPTKRVTVQGREG